MSKGEKLPKPSKVEVGQRWRYEFAKEDYVILREEPDGWRLWFEKEQKESKILFGSGEILRDTYLGAPESPQPVERDWSRWLPPGPLPDTGPKVLKPGQVWAVGDADGERLVLKVSGRVVGEILAGKTTTCAQRECMFSPNDTRSRRAVLIADVGCEPTEPDVLYGTAKAPGDGYHDMSMCTFCAGGIACPGLARQAATGHMRVTGGETWKAAAPIAVAAPKLREVSHNGRDWTNYDRLTDPDPFIDYDHKRVNGKVLMTTAEASAWKASHRVKGRYDDRNGETSCFREHMEPGTFRRAPAKRPWTPSCDDFDLLPGV